MHAVAWAIAAVLAGYLSGSVSWAVIITHAVAGRDIRDMGNKNPGTANVGRSIGRGFGAAVFLLDGLKALVPMILARAFLFGADTAVDFFVVTAVGVAAILGHIKPLYHRFRGGGGVGASIFVFLFLIPVEMFVSMVLATLAVNLLLPKSEYKYGRWVPLLLVILIPVVTTAATFAVNIPLFLHVSIGGHPWYLIVSVVAVATFVLLMNLRTAKEEILKKTAQR